MLRRLVLLVVLSAPGLALADPSLECSATAGSQVETGACLGTVEATVNATLDLALGFAMTSAADLDSITGLAAAAPALDASQAAWLAFRDAHCDYVGTTFGGGSGTGIAITSCRIDLTRARISDLMAMAQ